VDGADGRRGRRRAARPPARRAGLPAARRPAQPGGRRSQGRADASTLAVIVPVLTIVGDTDAELAADRARARASLSFYGSTPTYAFIFDEAGFEGTTQRLRAHQRTGDVAAMAAEITDEHLAVFCTEASWDGLAGALRARYADLATRLVMYNPALDPERIERYGEVARRLSAGT
jgi:hypothetical protein